VALTKYAKASDKAIKFFNFVQTPTAKEIFQKHGFGLYFEPRPDQYME
jgi:ABC-type molybdate transport system substrate-binding protein